MAEERSGDSSLQGRRQEKIESDGSSPSLGLPQVGVCMGDERMGNDKETSYCWRKFSWI